MKLKPAFVIPTAIAVALSCFFPALIYARSGFQGLFFLSLLVPLAALFGFWVMSRRAYSRPSDPTERRRGPRGGLLLKAGDGSEVEIFEPETSPALQPKPFPLLPASIGFLAALAIPLVVYAKAGLQGAFFPSLLLPVALVFSLWVMSKKPTKFGYFLNQNPALRYRRGFRGGFLVMMEDGSEMEIIKPPSGFAPSAPQEEEGTLEGEEPSFEGKTEGGDLKAQTLSREKKEK